MKLLLLVWTALFCSVFSLPGKKPPKHPATSETVNDSELMAKTDHLLFNVTIDEFSNVREAALAKDEAPSPKYAELIDSRMDFASDGCSSSPDHPFNFNFLPSCQRHDFGYRNYHTQDRFTELDRERVDNNLYQDLLNLCSGEEHQRSCSKIAKLYFKAVRKYGGGHKAILAMGGKEVEDLVGEIEMELALGE